MDVTTDPDIWRRLRVAEQLGALAGVALQLRNISQNPTISNDTEEALQTISSSTTVDIAQPPSELPANDAASTDLAPEEQSSSVGMRIDDEASTIIGAAFVQPTITEALPLPLSTGTSEPESNTGALSVDALNDTQPLLSGGTSIISSLADKIANQLRSDPTRGFSPAELRDLDTTPGSVAARRQRFACAMRLLRNQGLPIVGSGKVGDGRYRLIDAGDDGNPVSEAVEVSDANGGMTVMNVTDKVIKSAEGSQTEAKLVPLLDKPVAASEGPQHLPPPIWEVSYEASRRMGMINGTDIQATPAMIRVISRVSQCPDGSSR